MEVSDKIGDLEQRVAKLEASKPYMEKILEDVVDSNKELSKAIGGLQGFVNTLNNKIDEQGKKIDKLDTKVEAVEEQNKFNFVDWFKKNLPWIIVVLGVGGLYASQYVKF